MKLELAKEFAKHILTGDHLHQDEDGHYVKYDTIAMDVDTGQVRFLRGKTEVAAMQLLRLVPGITLNTTLNITQLDGRMRLAVDALQWEERYKR